MVKKTSNVVVILVGCDASFRVYLLTYIYHLIFDTHFIREHDKEVLWNWWIKLSFSYRCVYFPIRITIWTHTIIQHHTYGHCKYGKCCQYFSHEDWYDEQRLGSNIFCQFTLLYDAYLFFFFFLDSLLISAILYTKINLLTFKVYMFILTVQCEIYMRICMNINFHTIWWYPSIIF